MIEIDLLKTIACITSLVVVLSIRALSFVRLGDRVGVDSRVNDTNAIDSALRFVSLWLIMWVLLPLVLLQALVPIHAKTRQDY